jgi:membrane protein YqaA with SNARE-associated domain
METISPFFATPNFGLLFLLSFLAATLLPIGSEWLLVVMIIQGFSLPQTVVVATCGNTLGACSTYAIGIWGSNFLIRRVLRLEDGTIERASNLYRRWGSWSLLLSWLPVIGDPLCLVAGIFRVGSGRFGMLVFVGKFCRYATVALLAQAGKGF